MPISYALIGQNIKAARTRNRMSQEQLAEALGVSVTYISKIERGTKKINLDRLGQLNAILHMPVEYFIHGFILDVDQPAGGMLERIAAGCSPELIRTMVRVCEVIAQHERG